MSNSTNCSDPADRDTLVLGRIPVQECFRAKKRAALRLHLLDGAKGLGGLIGEAQAQGVEIKYESRQRLDVLAETSQHQGVILEAAPLPLVDLGVWLTQTDTKELGVAVLDEIGDPQNFGAIVRSATACGLSAVIFGKDRAAPLSPAALKAGAGAFEYIDLIQVTNIGRSIQSLKDSGFWIAGMAEQGANILWETDLGGRIAFVIGNEGKGIRKTVLQACDYTVRIPMKSAISSLNAASCATACFAEWLRQGSIRHSD